MDTCNCVLSNNLFKCRYRNACVSNQRTKTLLMGQIGMCMASSFEDTWYWLLLFACAISLI